MDNKNNNSHLKQEKLLYLPPSYEMKQKSRQMVQERGFFKSLSEFMGPVIKENPFPFIGISMMLGCLAGSFYYGMKGQREKASNFLQYKSIIGMFTVISFGAGLYYREYKAKNYARELEKLESEE